MNQTQNAPQPGIRFGTAGQSESFAAMGYKSSLDIPEYTAKFGLTAFEYQCGRGVRLGQDKAAKMAADAAARGILFSLHAPYYISMSSLEEEKRLNSIDYLLQSAAAVRAHTAIRIRPAVVRSAAVAKVWASPVFFAKGNRAMASPDRARSSTKARPMASKACFVG